MLKAKTGDTVKVHYVGTIENNVVFDDSYQRKQPMEFKIGANMLIQKFEDTVVGMSIGEKRTVNIPSDEAYGPHKKEMVVTVPRNQLPADIQPVVGMQLQVSQDEQVFAVTIAEVTDTTLSLDANHPLAGKDLTFNIELVEILPPGTECHGSSCSCGGHH
ncbi:MAG TPA: peptidylprolyl isomerase [Candidatus Omnitrophota bacterium]|jgi:peptidylprolyl isomerase|nr:peptidylprolyl isomerase [Candidatus Omnitrophota bacterium]HRZ14788.1 peptidylprolyl isomerase [Candidatus Omnitrophota bacterium]